MNYQWDFSFLLEYKTLIWQGALYTLGFTVLTAVSGLTVGCIIALARLSGIRWLAWPLLAISELFRCTPVLVQLVWCYYALPILIGVNLSPPLAAFITLTMYGGSFYAEIIRGGIISIDAGQWDAGRALGMRIGALMRRIVLPQAFRRMVPAFTNRSIELAKMTAIASVVSVHELMYEARLLSANTYRPLEVFTVIALVYFVLIYPGTLLAYRLERRLARSG